MADVEKYETPDPYTFVVHLKSTNAVFIDLLKSSTYPLVVLPADQKDKPAREVEIIGTGPFKLGEWQKDSHLVLLRNENYVPDETAGGPDGFAGKKTVYVDSVRYIFIPEANARLAALQTKKVDAIADLTLDLAKRLDGNAELATLKTFPYCQQYFVLHATNGLTANPLIRPGHSRGRQCRRHRRRNRHTVAAQSSLLYPASPYYAGEMATTYYDQKSPEKAKELLKQAGYKGEKLILQTNSNYPYMRDSILVLSEQLKEAGINADVQVIDWMSNSNNLQRGTGNWNVSTTSFCSPPSAWPATMEEHDLHFPAYRQGSADGCCVRQPVQVGRPAGAQDRMVRYRKARARPGLHDQGGRHRFAARLQYAGAGAEAYFYMRFWNTWLK